MSKSKAKPTTQPRKSKPPKADESPARRQQISEAAYLKAERRGFAPGCEEIDWLEAEKEIDDERLES